MTTDEKRQFIELLTGINEIPYGVACPPGTFALAIATAIIAPLGLLFLIWALYPG